MTEAALLARIDAADLVGRSGRVCAILPTYIEADGPDLGLGALCSIEIRPNGRGSTGTSVAEIVGVQRGSVILAPFDDRPATFAGACVRPWPGARRQSVGDGFLGRVIDALGRPIDGAGTIEGAGRAHAHRPLTCALDRASDPVRLETGIRAIDGLLTIGRGQRLGVFAASGVGKTTLLQQLANQVDADKIVLCLVGERGREVEQLWSRHLATERKGRSVLVAATSDETAAMRVRAVGTALTLAEYWRDQGDHVLLVLDSITRYAMALREIGLAAGEPPTIRAYPPSVFSALPKVVERCGALRSGGAITAVLSVLSETDDNDDPICELMKSVLDGHVVLARELAEQGHYPAIDPQRSLSRLAPSLMSTPHRAAAEAVVRTLSTYAAARTLIDTGVYVSGASAEIDAAVSLRPAILQFLSQRPEDYTPFEVCSRSLASLMAGA